MTRLLFALLFASNAFAQYGESITVSRIVVDMRVTKTTGEPITDLKPEDFTIRVNDKPVRVISATWIDEAEFEEGEIVEVDGERVTPGEAGDTIAAPPSKQGRLFVALVLTDFVRNANRVNGQLKFNAQAKDLTDALLPNDRVAVFSFDSHLKFRSDFTTDKEVALAAIRESILINHPTPKLNDEEPSLAPFLDAEEMKRAANAERALLLLSKALAEIEGPKTLLLCGWGMGELFAGRVWLDDDWDKARDTMLDSRVTIVSINTSLAPGQLAMGTSHAATATGGFTTSIRNPHQAIHRVTQSLRGRYDIELDAGDLPPGTYKLAATVKRGSAIVLAPMSVSVSPRN